MNRRGFSYISVLGVMALLLVLPVAVFLVGQKEGSQDIRGKAVEEEIPSPVAPTSKFLVDSVYVDADLPNKSLAGSDLLWADGSSRKIAYLKFDLSKVSNRQWSKALMRLYLVRDFTGSADVLAVPVNSWNSQSVTFQNRPSVGKKLATIVNGIGGQWVSVDLSSYAKELGSGMMSVAIETSSLTGLGFNSSKAASNLPELVVE